MTHPFIEPSTEKFSLDMRPCPHCHGNGEAQLEGELLPSTCPACTGTGLLENYDPRHAPIPY
jgi:DnaJ-class molecular chaperone